MAKRLSFFFFPQLVVLTFLPTASVLAHAAAPANASTSDAFADELKDMTFIGFEQMQDSVRVFVQTSDPVRYTVDTSHENLVVLVLDNCRVPVFNNTRPLDTEYFDGPVRYIEARPIDSPSASVRVEIHLRQKVAMRPVQKDTYLAIDFQKQQQASTPHKARL